MLAIAKHTLLRLRRQKAPTLAAYFAVLLLVVYYLGLQGFAQYALPIATLAHPAGIANLFAMLFAVFLGATLFSDDKSCSFTRTMMTKPVAAWQYVAGRLLGCTALLAMVWAALCTILVVMMLVDGDAISVRLIFALGFAFFGQMIILALTTLLSQFLAPLISGVLALLLSDKIFYSFSMNIDQFDGPASIKWIGQFVVRIAYYIVPQVSEFQLWGTHNYYYLIDPVRTTMAALYALGYLLLAYAATVVFFERSKW